MVPPPAKACPTSSDSEHSAFDRPKRRKYRETTVYDAVAGRACYRGLIRKPPLIASTRDTASSSTVRIPPEEVLFRSRGAPQRYEETDFYWANEKLPLQGAELPDSDLLKAVHAYASNFYGRRGGKADFHSLDETALMAVGVLLEERADDLLGNGGEGVFVEGEAVKEGESIHKGEGLKEGEAANDEEAVKAEEEMVGEGGRFKDPSLADTETRASWSKKQYGSSQAGPSRTCALFFSLFFLASWSMSIWKPMDYDIPTPYPLYTCPCLA